MDSGHLEHFPPCVADRNSSLDPVAERAKLTVADEMIEALETLGYRMAFGIPGGGIANIFHSLSKSDRIQSVLTQSELGAAYMAMGQTLASRGRSIGLCFGTSGPGITNMITGVAAAHQEGVPIFVISGNVATRLRGKGAVQDGFDTGIHATRMLEPVTAKSITVLKTEDAVAAIHELHSIAKKTHRPVHLNIPIDIAHSPAIGGTAWLPTFEETPENQDHVLTVARQIVASERPLILAGHGVKASGLEKTLTRALEATGIPVIATSHGKGVVPENHPLYFGCYGFAAPPESADFLKHYRPTCIVYLGTRLGELSTAGWSSVLGEPEMRVHVDRDASQFGRNYTPTHPICAEIADFLNALGAQSAEPDILTTRHSELSRCREEQRKKSQRSGNTDTSPKLAGLVNPESLMQILDLCLPEDAVIFSDIGNSMAWLIHHFSVGEKQDFHVPLGLGSMGSGICAAIGAKTVHADRPVICVTGDCSALMHGTELFTAVQAGLGVKLLILNDGGHGMVHHGLNLVGLTGTHVRFKQPADFAAFGKALGVKTYQVHSLDQFIHLPLNEIFESAEPMIIEVRTDPHTMPPILARAKVVGNTEIVRN